MEHFLLAALVGIGVGMLSGLLGVGGGTVMVPLFRLVFGLEPLMATATSLFTIIPTSVSGLAKHARNKTSVPRVGAVCGLAGACFSPVGVWAATKSPGWLVMAAAAAVILYSSFTMFKKALSAGVGEDIPCSNSSEPARKPHRVAFGSCGNCAGDAPADPVLDFIGLEGKPSDPTSISQEDFSKTSIKTVKLLIIGAVAGLCGGYVGVGGGFIMVPLFVAWLHMPMRLASGTSLMAVCLLAVPGVVEQALLGNIHYTVGIAMALGTVPGAALGASLVSRVPERALRFLFAGFLAVMACVLLLTETGVLG